VAECADVAALKVQAAANGMDNEAQKMLKFLTPVQKIVNLCNNHFGLDAVTPQVVQSELLYHDAIDPHDVQLWTILQ